MEQKMVIGPDGLPMPPDINSTLPPYPADMISVPVAGHEPSLLPAGCKWKLVWNDEFDGKELDRSKWDYRLNYWGRRNPIFTDEAGAITVEDSCAKFHLLYRDGQFCSAQLQTGANSLDAPYPRQVFPTEQGANEMSSLWPVGEKPVPKFMHRYGYYEVRCKFQKTDGWWSAFWTQSPQIGMAPDPRYAGVESDIMECFFGSVGRITTSNIYGGYSQKELQREGLVRYLLEESPDGFHRFGMDWTPYGYTFYCDGKVTTHCVEAVSHVEQFLLLTTECKGYRKTAKPDHRLHPEDAGDTFTVDYVRVFDRVM